MKRIAGSRLRGGLAALALSLVLGTGLDLSAQIRPDVERLLNEGLSQYQRGQLDQAQQNFEKALMLDITSEEALEWVEKVGYGQLVAALRGGNGSIKGQVSTLLELTSVEFRQRERSEEQIEAALSSYFASGDRLEQTKSLYTAVNTHGVYLMPGLVARAAEADQPTRVKAILAITKLSDDAVMPLTRVLQSSEVRQVQAAIAALQKIGNPAAIPGLLAVAQTHADSIVQREAAAAAEKLGASSTSAYDALCAQANRFYNDSNFLTRSYHDPVIWKMDGDQLSYELVDGWALNELRASQVIADARAINDGPGAAHVLFACNQMARYAEYRDIQEGDLDEARLALLRSRDLEMRMVQSQAYALPASVLLEATDLALTERRPTVAIELINALTSFVPAGERAEQIPATLGRALEFDHRGVRFAAARCVAYHNPRGGYAAGDNVINELTEGLTKAGRRVALTVIPDEDDHLHVAGLLERANINSFNDMTGIGGLQRALSFPKDVIVLAPGLADLPTAELIRRLRDDYRTRSTPIIVVSPDASITENEATYASEENNVLVINRSIDPLRLRDDLLANVLSSDLRAKDEALAADAAETLRYLSARETAFDLAPVGAALVQALENPNDSVRIPSCRAIASLGIARASNALVRICQEGDANSVALRAAAYEPLGQIHRGGSITPSVRAVLAEGAQLSDVQLQRAASRAMGTIGPAIQSGE